jgi:SecD/SecF fusion protein
VPRTINTGLGAMFILGALTVLGGDSLTGFAVALLIGLVVGTLSSVFTASPPSGWRSGGGGGPRPSGGTRRIDEGRRPLRPVRTPAGEESPTS